MAPEKIDSLADDVKGDAQGGLCAPLATPNDKEGRLWRLFHLPSEMTDEGDIICGKSIPHCEDERIGILFKSMEQGPRGCQKECVSRFL
jgi:hypothetical protein